MADNYTTDAGSGGNTYASDDISSVHYPIVKIALGALDANDGPVASGNPLPVTGTITAVTDITNTVTVDGTITEANSGAIKTAVELIDDMIEADGSGTVAVGAVVLGKDGTTPRAVHVTATGEVEVVSNAAAIATQATLANLDGNVTVCNTGAVVVASGAITETNSGDIKTAVEIIDDIVLVEDAAHGSGDKGVMTLVVQQSADASLVGADGDYAPLQVDDSGFLKVNIKAGAGSGGTAITDDAAFTVGTTSLTPVGGTYKSSRDSVDDNDAGAFAMTAKRGLYVTLETPNGDSAMDDTNDAVKVVNATAANLKVDGSDVTQPVSGTVTETNSGAIKTAVEKIDNAIDGTEMQVDVVAELPAGTQTIGSVKVTDGSTVMDIGEEGVTLNSDDHKGPIPLVECSVAAPSRAGDVDKLVPMACDANGKLFINATGSLLNGYATEGSALSYGVLIQGDDGTDRKNVAVDPSTGDLQVDVTSVGSIIDAGNSTATPLGGDATFTGTGVDLLGYSAVCITLASNVDSATDGMTFEFSTDNSNWDDIYTFTFDVSECPARRFQFPVTARYFRIVYTNGAGGQSSFRVQTILHTANQMTSIHRLDDDINPDRSAHIVKSIVFAQAAGAGDYVPVQATAAGNFKMSVEEFDSGASLPAGTNNIGDVDVLTLPDSIDGPGAPSIDSYTSDDINLAAATADQEIVSAPGANKQIWVYGIALTAAAAASVSIQDEDNTALSGVMEIAETGGFVINPSGNFAMPWLKVATNKALEIDTVGAGGTVDGIITYAIVSV